MLKQLALVAIKFCEIYLFGIPVYVMRMRAHSHMWENNIQNPHSPLAESSFSWGPGYRYISHKTLPYNNIDNNNYVCTYTS